ncbi:MAG: 50S ribosomal protein L4 [Terriglobia bacterium]
MATVKVYSDKGKEVDKVQLGKEFSEKPNLALVHEASRLFRAQTRSGTASTKARAEVRGGGVKPWRQKGTGRARAGSIRSPLWRGGGVTFGPTPRAHTFSMTKRAKRKALLSALSSKAAEGGVIVLDKLSFKKPRTKEAASILGKLKAEKATVVLPDDDQVGLKSFRNIDKVHALRVSQINSYYVSDCDTLVLTRDSLGKLVEALKP